MSFAVGSTVEQRYPGATAELARSSARGLVAAFETAGWAVREERWVADGAGSPDPAAGPPPPFPVVASGTLVVVFVATREASVPVSLRPQPVEREQGPRFSAYTIRLMVGLVVFFIVVGILLSVGLPVVGTLMGGSPQPFKG